MGNKRRQRGGVFKGKKRQRGGVLSKNVTKKILKEFQNAKKYAVKLGKTGVRKIKNKIQKGGLATMPMDRGRFGWDVDRYFIY